MFIDEICADIAGTPGITGVSITGGDPLEQYEALLDLCRNIKKTSNLDIVMFTGYTYSEIEKKFASVLDIVDFIVDGRFEKDLASPNLYFRGSSNQNYIDVKQTKEASKLVTRTS